MFKVRKWLMNILITLGVALILVLAIWGPERLASNRDKYYLEQVIEEPAQEIAEGYKYSLSSNEKLYILSECLSNQVLPETELSQKTQVKNEVDYEGLNGTYALVVNQQGPAEQEIKESEIFEVFNKEIAKLKELEILPQGVKEVKSSSYSAELYSAIDVLEPRNNVSVWKVTLSTSQQNADKSNRVLDAYVDAQTGKVYEFYVRIEDGWNDLKPAEIVGKWSDYLELEGVEVYETDNPLLETTPHFLKYRIPGGENNNTIVTIGFYEGINELFLKITR